MKPRICHPVPIQIRTKGSRGERIRFEACIDDFSAGGFSAHAATECRPGQELFFVIRIPSFAEDPRSATVASRGIVLRSEKLDDGSFSFASTVGRHRFI